MIKNVSISEMNKTVHWLGQEYHKYHKIKIIFKKYIITLKKRFSVKNILNHSSKI